MKQFGWVDWGGDGPVSVFAHANGFPVASYKPLLDHLIPDLQVVGWQARPLQPGSDPQEISSWYPLADDLRIGIESRFDEPVIGIGHSLGGILSLLTAASHPKIFDALVLIDPVLFSGARSVVWGQMKRWGQADKMPLRAGALRRRALWPDRESVRRAWTGKAAFEGWTGEAIEAYIQAGFEDEANSGGVRLRYPKEWEARIFGLTPHNLWRDVAKLKVPVLVLRGEHSDTFSEGAVRKFQRKARHSVCQDVEGTGHMLPMQKPEKVAALIKRWLRNL